MSLTPQDEDRRTNSPPLQGRGRGWGVSANRLTLLHDRAAEMRGALTEPEKRLWTHLSRSQLGGFKFRRQAVIGQFIVDFLCSSRGLAVEVDGDTHDPVADARRDATLAAHGITVLRVANCDVLRNIDGVLETILGALLPAPARSRTPHPNPSPEGEGPQAAE